MLNWNPLRTKTMIKRFSKVDFYKIGDPLYANPLSPFPKVRRRNQTSFPVTDCKVGRHKRSHCRPFRIKSVMLSKWGVFVLCLPRVDRGLMAIEINNRKPNSSVQIQKIVGNPNHHSFSKEYCNTPPICTAKRLQFVLQCFRCHWSEKSPRP